MRLARSLLPLSTILVTSACAESSAEWRGAVRDSAGVAIVENPAEPLSADAWVAREVLRIGSAAGDPRTQFGLIASIDVADDGRIYVLDQQHRRVRVFAPDGSFERELGGSGAGPGELSGYAIAAMVGPGDTVFVADLGNVRLERFAPDGSPAGSIPLPVPTRTMPNRIAMLEDGRVVEMVRAVQTPSHPEPHDQLLLVLSRAGGVADTLHRMPSGGSIEFRGGVAVLSAFAEEPLWALGEDDRLYTGMNDRYRIEVRQGGRLERVIERAHEPRAVTEEDRRAFLLMLRRSLSEQGMEPMAVEQMVESMTFADRYPVFAYFTPGPRGSLWVQHVRTAQDAAAEGTTYDATEVGSDRWDVFDAEGRFVTTMRLPKHFTPLVHRGDLFYGTWQDELDVSYVMAVEVRPADAAAQ
jgi:hypothetical protein